MASEHRPPHLGPNVSSSKETVATTRKNIFGREVPTTQQIAHIDIDFSTDYEVAEWLKVFIPTKKRIIDEFVAHEQEEADTKNYTGAIVLAEKTMRLPNLAPKFGSGHDKVLEILGITDDVGNIDDGKVTLADSLWIDRETLRKVNRIKKLAEGQVRGREEEAWKQEIAHQLELGDYWGAGIASQEQAKDFARVDLVSPTVSSFVNADLYFALAQIDNYEQSKEGTIDYMTSWILGAAIDSQRERFLYDFAQFYGGLDFSSQDPNVLIYLISRIIETGRREYPFSLTNTHHDFAIKFASMLQENLQASMIQKHKAKKLVRAINKQQYHETHHEIRLIDKPFPEVSETRKRASSLLRSISKEWRAVSDRIDLDRPLM